MTRRMFHTLAALAIILPLAACTGDAHRQDDILGPFFFACDDGRTITVRFDKAEHTAWVLVPGLHSHILPQTRSADGFWYTNGTYRLRGQDHEVWWQKSGKLRVRCRQLSEQPHR